ncbi:MAG: hypothetical protein ACK5L3_05595 [Oscillospiraceae bacterium]
MKTTYRNTAFFVEVLVCIVVFSIAGAILAGAFGKASMAVRQTQEESLAGSEMYALVETYRARGQAGLAEGEALSGGGLAFAYAENWQQVQAGGGVYTVTLFIQPQQRAGGVLSQITAVATRSDGTEIYRLETAVYRPGEGGLA